MTAPTIDATITDRIAHARARLANASRYGRDTVPELSRQLAVLRIIRDLSGELDGLSLTPEERDQLIRMIAVVPTKTTEVAA
ncbi:hypothetical protein GONAM_16_00310 [Gordonia namibiensis NBRC 108229]|uniref:Uncharacterized protein n=1 Tax=Gordonia namibiensis NBRC 108229 TaxID=1208314 RepID=K6X381_9ACTN|nr:MULTISPECIES: hypothetical protein [Gordonia]ASR04012.1 hypothetical protein GCWB2_16135 [Gordonia rubripertincta]GAC00532.1 hypothetical protein GONAM_16_00310 [Gordonia namibiensis NBRC 108229]